MALGTSTMKSKVRRGRGFGLAVAVAIVSVACGHETIDRPTGTGDAGVDSGSSRPSGPTSREITCNGTIRVCDGLAESECETRPECEYARECVTSATFRCGDLGEGACEVVPGCRWNGTCEGFPTEGHCERFSRFVCESYASCELLPNPLCRPRRACAQIPVEECSTLDGCSAVCPPHHRRCGNRCVDVRYDEDHCGACGAWCAGSCDLGVCTAYGPCTSDAECAPFEDADGCNGVVSCVGGACQRTAPISCDDGISCTRDACGGGTCTHAPVDALCAAGERCDPAAGCVAEAPCTLGSCPEGFGCYPSTNAYCIPEGPRAEGGRCFESLDCNEGLECMEIELRLRICARSCVEGCPGETCSMDRCTLDCSLLPSDTVCGVGTRCLDTRDGRAECRPLEDDRAEGATCVDQLDCGRGLRCIRESSRESRCRTVCDLDGAATCPAGRCIGLEPPLVVNGRTYGACLPR